MALYNSVLDTIGRTPIVRLNHIAPKHVSVYVKVESFNPGGSVKDRLALAVVLDAERRGELKPGDTIVECISGNVGIGGMSAVAAQCCPINYDTCLERDPTCWTRFQKPPTSRLTASGTRSTSLP